MLITTESKLISSSRLAATRQTFLLVRPWDRSLLDLPDSADGMERMEDVPVFRSVGENEPADSESQLRALRLTVRLGQPFRTFLLAQQCSGEYTRVATDFDIVAQVEGMASVRSMMDVRTLEIL
ncbi:uncharacterized protein EDB91DRAFT_1129478 [Suillus paluster]|uniref:uncharacterized protein n=1 Tax=Suillus paluster TaxID=48578 RepID=UPI001B87B286|nr:uncharacterized protein EDB91DRAFT_1129478 [Suillus paluster]KAG1741813.1 hypothetical protein EDB91DRAFT_1129478 [Suillus paluster]